MEKHYSRQHGFRICFRWQIFLLPKAFRYLLQNSENVVHTLSAISTDSLEKVLLCNTHLSVAIPFQASPYFWQAVYVYDRDLRQVDSPCTVVSAPWTVCCRRQIATSNNHATPSRKLSLPVSERWMVANAQNWCPGRTTNFKNTDTNKHRRLERLEMKYASIIYGLARPAWVHVLID